MAEKVLRADARRNLELILQAAGETFAERGLEASVADVAARAGVGTATIFRRFPTKDDLIDAVIRLRMEQMREHVRAAAEAPDGLATLRRLLLDIVATQQEDKGFVDSVGKGRFAAVPGYAELRDEMMERMGAIVERAQAVGEVRADLAAADLPVLMHMLAHAAQMLEPVEPGAWERYLDVVLDGLRPGAATPLSRAAVEGDVFARAQAAACEAPAPASSGAR